MTADLHYIHYITLHYTMLVIFCRQCSHPNCILTWPANHLSTGSLDIVCDSFAIRYLSSTSLQFTMCMENDDSRHYIYITLHYIGHGGHILSTGSLDKEYEEKWGAKSGGRGGIYQTMGEKKNSSPQEIFGPRNIFLFNYLFVCFSPPAPRHFLLNPPHFFLTPATYFVDSSLPDTRY